MPQKPPLKMWDKSRNIEVIVPSRYEQNEASVKAYWRNYMADLELSYKDDKFWESQAPIVRSIVPSSTFRKLAKIYDLPLTSKAYCPASETSSPPPSLQYYRSRTQIRASRSKYSMSDFESEITKSKTALPTDESSSSLGSPRLASPRKSSKSLTRRSVRSIPQFDLDEEDEWASTRDDLIVHCEDKASVKRTKNPHHEMLRTNKTDADMITWNSKYIIKQQFEVSASDEFSKKAEIVTTQIAREFFTWYSSMGEVEFKSELKRPEDIIELFQVWFDEHASRGMVLDSKLMPCVLQSVASASGVPEASCANVLKRQVASDMLAERTPAHTVAFGRCLPHSMKHIPPDNQTRQLWRSVRPPRDLATMDCVWQDIKHLSSTKEFQRWLSRRPRLAMPPCLRSLSRDGKKALFVIPSDFLMQGATSEEDLTLPVSQFDLELKTVLSQLMN